MTELVNVEINAGEPLALGMRTITPFAQSVQFKLPGSTGGLIWNRPVSVLVQEGSGEEHVLSVPDVTRQTIWALWGGSLFMVLIGWLIIMIFRR